MKHLRTISRNIPAPAQFESVLQAVGLLQSLLALYEYFSRIFGIPIPQKQQE